MEPRRRSCGSSQPEKPLPAAFRKCIEIRKRAPLGIVGKTRFIWEQWKTPSRQYGRMSCSADSEAFQPAGAETRRKEAWWRLMPASPARVLTFPTDFPEGEFT